MLPGIVHSDLKPANFIFVEASLKLIDFGIANAIQNDQTSFVKESQVGTLNYMSPEAIQDTSPVNEVNEYGHKKPRLKVAIFVLIISSSTLLFINTQQFRII